MKGVTFVGLDDTTKFYPDMTFDEMGEALEASNKRLPQDRAESNQFLFEELERVNDRDSTETI